MADANLELVDRAELAEAVVIAAVPERVPRRSR